MLFNSLTFICFLIILLLLYWSIPSWRGRKGILLAGSYLFYAAWNPPFVILLWLSTVIDWIAGRSIYRTEKRSLRTAWLLISLVVNLGLLGFFKYGTFLLDNFTALMRIFSVHYQPAAMDIILPVGISFYTFQTLSYTLDVYRRRSAPSSSFLDFALYVTFFPQLVAGPIVRAADFLPQCASPRRIGSGTFFWGLFLLSLGLFEKVVLADGFLSSAADTVFGFSRGTVHMLDAWVGVLAFSGQIFCDFAGYSTCAIGTALLFGFHLPDNFRYPYAAVGFSDFWRRWHISLSTWLRDYLYISLGGSRKGAARTAASLMLTMLIGGLWHGASWTFVAWGGIHGVYLLIERVLKRVFQNAAWVKTFFVQAFLGFATYILICITWVFFRAQSFEAAGSLLASLFGLHPQGTQILSTLDILKVLVVISGMLLVQWRLKDTRLEAVLSCWPWRMVSIVWAFMLAAVILMQGGSHAFIYFQF